MSAKLEEPDLCSFLKHYDIICLCETWLCEFSDVTSLNLDGYTFKMFNRVRRNLTGRHSGGILIFIRNNLIDMFSIRSSSSELVDFCIGKSRFIFLYAAPEDSVQILNGSDPMNSLEKLLYENLHDRIYIFGDFNARSGSLVDHVDAPPRVNADPVNNPRGKRLIDLCSATDLMIANGRLGDPIETGEFTFISSTGQSAIDYLLVPKDNSTEVLSMSLVYRPESDHMPITFDIKCPLPLNTTVRQDNPGSKGMNPVHRYVWDPTKRDIFRESLREKLSMPTHWIDGECEGVEEKVDYIKDALISSSSCMKKKRTMNFVPKKKWKSWFDLECRKSKGSVTAALSEMKAASRKGSLDFEACKRRYCDNRRIYKKLLKRKERNFSRKATRELVALRHKNPREFWKKLSWKKKSGPIAAPAKALHQYFSSMFECPNEHPQFEKDIITSNQLWLDRTFISDPILDCEITTEEVENSIKDLKAGKAAGSDNILPELIKNGSEYLVLFLKELFNQIMSTQNYPKLWQEQVLHPILKKGDPLDPSNYRGISLLNIMSKPFLTIVFNRMQSFCENRQTLIDEQGGFRAGRWTTDNIFALHCQLKNSLGKKNGVLYCLFVDFRKCFDSINRNFLWHKLILCGFSTNFVKLVMSIYDKVVLLLRSDGESETRQGSTARKPGFLEEITSNIGLKQGCKLSTILFSLFTNDILSALKVGIELEKYTSLIGLLFADDMIIFHENPSVMRKLISNLESYTVKWGLSVNLEKTQMVVFRNGKRECPKEQFFFNNELIALTEEYKYLGVIFHSSGKWIRHIDEARKKSVKAMYSLKSKVSKFADCPVREQIDLYKTCVQSTLLYGAEIWGCSRIDGVEMIQTNFAKSTLGVRRKTPNIGALAELGLLPYKKFITLRMIKFWLRIVNARQPILLESYNLLMKVKGKTWCTYIRDQLIYLGFPDVWVNQGVGNPDSFINVVLERIKCIHVQEFDAATRGMSRLSLIHKLQIDPCSVSPYLLCGEFIRKTIARFRLSSHSLSVETGRWRRPCIPRDQRFCPFCPGIMEDEFHFLIVCPEYAPLRRTLIPRFVLETPTEMNYLNLLRSESRIVIRKLATFVKKAFLIRANVVK